MSASDEWAFARRRLPMPTFDGPQDVLISRVTGQGTYFSIPAHPATDHEFGPAPWPTTATSPLPGAGTAAVAVFVGTGLSNPRIVWVDDGSANF